MVPGLGRELPGVSPKLCRARVAPAAVGSVGTEATAPVVVAEELAVPIFFVLSSIKLGPLAR